MLTKKLYLEVAQSCGRLPMLSCAALLWYASNIKSCCKLTTFYWNQSNTDMTTMTTISKKAQRFQQSLISDAQQPVLTFCSLDRSVGDLPAHEGETAIVLQSVWESHCILESEPLLSRREHWLLSLHVWLPVPPDNLLDSAKVPGQFQGT